MKHFLLSTSILIALVSLVVVSLLFQCILSSSKGTIPSSTSPVLQQTPQNALQPTPNVPSQSTQCTPKATLQTANYTAIQTASPGHSNRTLDEAIGNATNYLQSISEPYAFLWLNVAYRRFNVTVFADSLQRYDQALAQTSVENQPLLRIFRRIADHNNLLKSGDLQAVTSETDKLTVPALYCNQMELPPNYEAALVQAMNSQGYMKTHALLATIWVHENNCSLSVPAGFYVSLIEANVASINNDEAVTDLEIEAAAFLAMSGQSSLVPSVFIEKVIAAQNSDGGWPTINTGSEGSNWHASVLALLLLLHQKYPDTSYTPVLAAPQV